MNTTRRTFLVAGSLTALSAARAAGAADRLRVGILGPGLRGRGLLTTFAGCAAAQNAELVAVADVWTVNRQRAAEHVVKKGAAEPQKLRTLDELCAVKDLDGVIVATPDHQHAKQLITLLREKKHVYLEKPFANRMADANAAIDAARASDRVIAVGTQRRSDPRYVEAARLMKGGAVGPVVHVEVIQNAYSPYRWRSPDYVKELAAKDTDWSAWQMGRSDVPFDARRYAEFRLYRDYSTGIIDQWMTHMVDTMHLLTGVTLPRAATASGGTFAWKDGRENGDTVQVTLDYGAFLGSYGCTLANGSGARAMVLGRDGTLEYETAWRVSPREGKAKAIEASGPDMDAGHMTNWLACVRKGDRATNCTAEHGYGHAVACVLADAALHAGRRMRFDEKKREAVAG